MNKADLLIYRNRIIRLVDTQRFRIDRKAIYFGSGSKKHEQIKFDICWELKKMKMEFVTEARFKNEKGVADILILDTGTVIEILVSETLEQVKEKVKKYPDELEVVATTGIREYLKGDYKIIR